MSYFLKKTKTNKGLYYQVYDGNYNKEKGYVSQKSISVIGYHEDLLKKGIKDPLNYAQELVTKMEQDRKEKLRLNQIKTIDDSCDVKNIGVSFISSFLDSLDIELPINMFNYGRKVKYKLFEIMKFLIASQIYDPSSKLNEYTNLKDKFLFNSNFTYQNMLDALDVLGEDYQSVIELFNNGFKKLYKFTTDKVFFDCTNYYFEIDKPYDDKQKGPSKENRNNPIIGMGLLLDKNQMPISMKMFPGNNSEKPIIREIINEMKKTNQIQGRTIQVADKGLNCGQNIFECIKNNDGYIYSNSVKKLSAKELVWVDKEDDYIKDDEENCTFKYKECIDDFKYDFVFNNNKYSRNFKQKRIIYWSKKLEDKHKIEINLLIEKAKKLALSQAKKSEYGECSRYINFAKIDDNGEITLENVKKIIDQEKIEKDLKYCGFNMLVTSETSMPAKEIYNVYHRLWRIEESFRILKTNLCARPIYLQGKNKIYGHFLICYLSLVFIRYIELIILNDEIPAFSIINFIRKFEVFENEELSVNLLKKKYCINNLISITNLPINKKIFNGKDLESFKKYRFSTIK
jgi:transposase